MDVWEGGQESVAKALQEPGRKVPTDGLTALLSRDCGLHSVFCAQRRESKQAKESSSASLPSQDNKSLFPLEGPAGQGRARAKDLSLVSQRRQQSMLPASHENKAPNSKGLVGFPTQ